VRYCVIPTYSKNPDGRLRVELNQNIDVTRTFALAARNGAEQRRVTNPAPVQLRLMSPQRGDDLFPINAGVRPRLMLNLPHRGALPSGTSATR
jgi:hypothetical protein